MSSSAPSQSGVSRARRRHAVLAAVVLSVLWLLFSGKYDVVHLAYGVFSVALVLYLCRDLFVSYNRSADNEFVRKLHWGRLLVYPFWLFKEIVVANIGVAKLILLPGPPIDPVIIRFSSRLEGSVARVTLGNSITLTPGTFTLELEGQDFVVHAITQDTASSITLGTMQKQVAAVFGEEEFETPQVLVGASDDSKEEPTTANDADDGDAGRQNRSGDGAAKKKNGDHNEPRREPV